MVGWGLDVTTIMATALSTERAWILREESCQPRNLRHVNTILTNQNTIYWPIRTEHYIDQSEHYIDQSEHYIDQSQRREASLSPEEQVGSTLKTQPKEVSMAILKPTFTMWILNTSAPYQCPFQ